MSIVPIITSDKAQFSEVSSLLLACDPHIEAIHLEKSLSAMEFLNIEMPELVIVNFSDEKIDTDLLMSVIKSDTWLLNSGLIGLCDSPRTLRESEKVRGTNMVAFIDLARLKQQFPRVISIICNNRRFLFQRVLGADLGNNLSAAFQLHNDHLEAACFVNLICNFLYNLNRIDAKNKDALYFVLSELLLNAIEHGNCGISYEEKTQWLEAGNDMIDLIDKKCSHPDIGKRNVFFEYVIHPDYSTFKITDEGEGFNWNTMKNPIEGGQMGGMHGRGIGLSRNMTRNLTFNEKGNALQFDFIHQEGISNVTPALFRNHEITKIPAKEIVFQQGEPSNFLYYIARGSFEVLVNESRVSVLTPDDIFLGEMSFLLNNRRSATVRAITDGSLIRISKKEFVEAIKEKPHYSLFLARLLAQRIERLNQHLGTLHS